MLDKSQLYAIDTDSYQQYQNPSMSSTINRMSKIQKLKRHFSCDLAHCVSPAGKTTLAADQTPPASSSVLRASSSIDSSLGSPPSPSLRTEFQSQGQGEGAHCAPSQLSSAPSLRLAQEQPGQSPAGDTGLPLLRPQPQATCLIRDRETELQWEAGHAGIYP